MDILIEMNYNDTINRFLSKKAPPLLRLLQLHLFCHVGVFLIHSARHAADTVAICHSLETKTLRGDCQNQTLNAEEPSPAAALPHVPENLYSRESEKILGQITSPLTARWSWAHLFDFHSEMLLECVRNR